MVEMRVRLQGEDTLVYTCRSVPEAAEMMCFLREFFPSAQFLVQPLVH